MPKVSSKTMKALTLLSVFLASVTGMSAATEPVRTYYKQAYNSNAATIAMIAGIVVSFIKGS